MIQQEFPKSSPSNNYRQTRSSLFFLKTTSFHGTKGFSEYYKSFRGFETKMLENSSFEIVRYFSNILPLGENLKKVNYGIIFL